MTRVCIVGGEDVDLRYELLSRETAREALAAYDLTRPFENSLSVRTVSLGAAVSFLNDLDWYLTRFADVSMVRDPSVDDDEWLSRALATAVRNDRLSPAETDRFYKLYGVDEGRLVEPLFVQPGADGLPEYDLRDVEETLAVRVSEEEFGG